MNDNLEAQRRRAARLRKQINQIGQPPLEDKRAAPLSPREAIEERMRELDRPTDQLTKATVQQAQIEEDTLIVLLRDGRRISVPLSWYPWLRDVTPEERKRWRLMESGEGMLWPDLGEEIKIEDLLSGHASAD